MDERNWFKPSSKIFYWPFQGGTSFVDHLWVFCVLCFSCFRVCLLLPCGHLLGWGWTLGSCWWCLLHLCYFPMWYPWSGVVLDCIIPWSLQSFLLCWASFQLVVVSWWKWSELLNCMAYLDQILHTYSMGLYESVRPWSAIENAHHGLCTLLSDDFHILFIYISKSSCKLVKIS